MCVFCRIVAEGQYFAENAHAVAFPDGFPLTAGHTLIVPRRHETDYFALTEDEQASMWTLVRGVRDVIERTHSPAGYNLGVNVGRAGGQTIGHIHLHVIPRYVGDVSDPRGGIRWVLPARASYWKEEGPDAS